MAPQYQPRVSRLTVHAVFVDGVVGDGLEELQLIAMVKLRTRNFDEGSVCERNTESIDTNIGKLVDSGCVDKRGITLLED